MRLYPLYHPAAALYTRSMVDVLREDFARLPEILAMGPPEQPVPEPAEAECQLTEEPLSDPGASADPGDGDGQLGLF